MANAELQVLTAVLQNKDIGILYGGGGTDELFKDYGDVWKEIKNYHTKHHAVPDFEVIQERFPDLEPIPVKGKTEYYLDALREEFVGGRIDNILLHAAHAREGSGSNEILQRLQVALAKLNRFSGTAQDLDMMDFDDAEAYYEQVRRRAEVFGGQPGIPTGVSFIDSAYTSGIAPGDLVVILGYTGRGKSLLATLFACNAHDHGFVPMVVSLEMSAQKVRDRVYTIMGSGLFQNSALALGDIGTDDFRTFRSNNASKPPLMVVTNDGANELTPNIVEAKIDQHKPSLVIVDYAQLASDNANSENMTQRMMNMSKEYKRLAVKKQVAIVLISSATAEGTAASATDEPPMIHQVAWSRQLAYDSDLAFAVYKYDDSNLINVVCRKNRNGPMFAGILEWDIDNGIIREVYDN